MEAWLAAGEARTETNKGRDAKGFAPLMVSKNFWTLACRKLTVKIRCVIIG
jgi:hypothetical protein